MVDLSTSLCGLNFINPVFPASGTFGYGAEFKNFFDLNILGAISVKATTKSARFGNPGPRIAECPSGMLNSVGLQNPGIDTVLNSELPALRKHYKNPIILNISGFSAEEYAYCCARADESRDVDIIEVNISCPNVAHGGMIFGTSAKNAAEITRTVRTSTKKTLFIKLSPNVQDIAEIARACESEGADGLCLINTLLGMRIDLKTQRPVLNNTFGGLSGPSIFPVALRMVYEVFSAVKIPIIGIGGISSAEDVAEMMMAGAAAVEVGTASIVNPYACRDIIQSLPLICQQLKIKRLRDISGAAHIK